MVTLVKHEWHQTDRQFTFELDLDILQEIYPDSDEQELEQLLADVERGDADIEEIVNDAMNNDVEIEWDHQYDDCWTDRKGGYDVTYELGDDSSYYTAPEDAPPTHKCTKCRWTGKSWETLTQYLREDGSVIGDSDDTPYNTKDVCPMCDSDVTLTEEGIEQEQRSKRLLKEIEAMNLDEE